MDTIKIGNLDTYGSNGWQWDVSMLEWDTFQSCDVQRVYHFRTNEQGNGLWQGSRQIEGTGQFSLPRNRTRALRALRYRWTGR